MIKLTLGQWARLHTKLVQDYPTSSILLRYKMKEDIGCTVRRHKEFKPVEDSIPRHGYYFEWIFLDFYDDVKETFFSLKYADYISLYNPDTE